MFENVYNDLLNDVTNGKDSVLITTLQPIDERKGTILEKRLLHRYSLENEDSEKIKEKIHHTFETGKPNLVSSNDHLLLIEAYTPKPRLIILGGGHIAKPLCEFASKVGFSVVVADDRPTFANTNRFPEASEVLCQSFERIFDLLNPRDSDFIVIVTRGHRHDGICLRKALSYTPAYIGMIGSKRRVKAMKEQLVTEGYSKDRIEGINSPIGLEIGAVTPEEIAISIIAQCIGFRRGAITKESGKSKSYSPEFDNEVIWEMAKKSEIPRALITIISSKGSVPRKAGAKMISWLDGRVLGSIGGGCSEAGILSSARDVILTKGYKIEQVDLTGDVAEEEGMVCGGLLEVLIEAF
ncbi:XdhC family protein [Alkaliphilus serpentinus]|uniref:Xanthine dehydrogenase n=1 Tax=Alkaliphilus serpentinus TaxID=1482731 RepID=A0A833MDR2_9FIRM|nr:XdhC/CoxI family protein [Alkaliphilus serpentinus]KAB3529305.1 xanthine dehydrogenase [Alkaliphilus serpentinus]